MMTRRSVNLRTFHSLHYELPAVNLAVLKKCQFFSFFGVKNLLFRVCVCYI